MDMQRACHLNDHLPDCDTFFFFLNTEAKCQVFQDVFFQKARPESFCRQTCYFFAFFSPFRTSHSVNRGGTPVAQRSVWPFLPVYASGTLAFIHRVAACFEVVRTCGQWREKGTRKTQTKSKRIMEWDRKLILIKMTNRAVWDSAVQAHLSKNSRWAILRWLRVKLLFFLACGQRLVEQY